MNKKLLLSLVLILSSLMAPIAAKGRNKSTSNSASSSPRPGGKSKKQRRRANFNRRAQENLTLSGETPGHVSADSENSGATSPVGSETEENQELSPKLAAALEAAVSRVEQATDGVERATTPYVQAQANSERSNSPASTEIVHNSAGKEVYSSAASSDSEENDLSAASSDSEEENDMNDIINRLRNNPGAIEAFVDDFGDALREAILENLDNILEGAVIEVVPAHNSAGTPNLEEDSSAASSDSEEEYDINDFVNELSNNPESIANNPELIAKIVSDLNRASQGRTPSASHQRKNKTITALIVVAAATVYYKYVAPRLAKRIKTMKDGRMKNLLLAVSFAKKNESQIIECAE